jgi:hypothetical protein
MALRLSARMLRAVRYWDPRTCSRSMKEQFQAEILGLLCKAAGGLRRSEAEERGFGACIQCHEWGTMSLQC